MPLALFVFLVGVVVTLILVAALVFTAYEVRRTNPHAFGPKLQAEPPPEPTVASSP